MAVPKPIALYDTLACLQAGVATSVTSYLNSLTEISDIERQYELSRQFLLSYAKSLDTFTAYRREVERFLQWCWLIAKKNLQAITRNDLRDFLYFVNSPPKSWINTKNVPRFILKNGEKIANSLWRPFTVKISKIDYANGKLPDKDNYQLKSRSIEALLAVLGTFFTYLQQEDYILANPVALIRQKNQFIQRQQTRRMTRKLSGLQWQTVIDVAEEMANQNPQAERVLFMMAAFYLLGLRISELAETKDRIPKMGDFAPDKQGLWWFTTVGKGNKIRDVAVPDSMLEILKRYRLSRGLSPLPAREEATPLLNKMRGRGGLSPRHIRLCVQQCFNQAISRLKQQDKLDEAQDLMLATVHWLRHTAISADIIDRPREHVRDDVGHENAATMDKYIDTDRLSRHQSAKYKKLRNPTVC